MLGFLKNKNPQTEDPAVDAGTTDSPDNSAARKFPEKKGAPTPRRRDQEALRRRPLVEDNRKLAKQRQRQEVAEQRARTRIAMETGDEKYLPVRDRGLQKRFARDWVDARTGVAEWVLIIMLIFLFASIALGEQVQSATSLFFLFIIVSVVFELWWVGRKVRKGIEARYGEGSLESGVRFYAAMRAMQMRRLRLPKPMVKRGHFPQ